jgi:hypothetical protein
MRQGRDIKCPRKTAYFVAGFLFFLDFFNLEDVTDTLSRNVGKGLIFNAA